VALNLNDRGAYLTRILQSGEVLDVVPLLLGRARLTRSQQYRDEVWVEGW
jgi:hypothetical protein